MKKQFNLIYTFFFIGSFLLASCDDEPEVGTKLYKEEQIDLTSTKAYLSTGSYPINKVYWKLIQTPVDIKKPEEDTIAFNVFLSKKENMDIEIKISDNVALAKKYNTEKNTDFGILPKGAFKIITPSIIIKKGDVKSSEKVKATIDYEKIKEMKEKSLGIISINQVSKGVKISSNMSSIHIELYKEFSNINDKGNLNTSKFIEKEKYNLTTNSYYSPRFNIDKASDGDASTTWISSGSANPFLQFNLEKMVEVKGIRTVPNCFGTYYGYNAKEIRIYTSLDGKNWKNQGSFINSNIPTNQSPIDITFYRSEKAKYIKLEITKGFDYFIGISEVSLAI